MKLPKRRIIICCASFPPEIGGASGRIYNLAVLLKELGYTVTVITAMPNHPTGAIFPAYRGRIVCKEDVEGIKVIRLWLIPANTGNWVARGLSLLSQSMSILLFAGPRLIFSRAEAVFVSSPPLFTSYLYGLLAKIGGKKLLVNISDIWPLTAKELGVLKDGFLMKVLKRMEQFLYNRASGITGQSEAILTHVRQYSVNGKELFLYRNLPVQNGLDGYAVAPVSGPRKIIYAGALGFAQGMLDICKNIDFKSFSLELHIYGQGIERNAVAQYLREHSDKGIYLHPTVSSNELSQIMHECAAMFIPLRNPIEGAVPSKLFTASAQGLPVLFCGGGEGESLVNEYGLGWTCTPGSASSLERMLAAFSSISDSDLAAVRKRIQESYKTTFSKATQDRQFKDYLEAVLKK